ncbi:MAG: RidA family protein [Gemmatimonadota bacterium]
MPFELLNPEALGPTRGWTNGMLAAAGGRLLLVAGQDAAEPGGQVTTDDFVEQFRRALDKVLEVVRAAGGGPQDVGRITVFVTDLDAYRASRKALGVVWREAMGRHYPAMALVEVRRLVDPRARVEMEATAVLASGDGGSRERSLAEGTPASGGGG